MRKIEKKQLNTLFSQIMESKKLYIPGNDGSGKLAFLPWSPKVKLRTDGNTLRSAKDLFFPQVENLVGFQRSGKQITVNDLREPIEPFAVFGVRGCDCRSFDILDRVFLAQPVDTFYARRREMATVITLACNDPRETCFCQNFSIDPAAPGGDVTCWMDETWLYWQENTEKGKELTEKLPCLVPCEEDAVTPIQEEIHGICDKLPLGKLDWSGFDREHMLDIFNQPAWADLSESCLGCGSCTFVCPTCQCYDVQEFDNGREITRFRCWDSCMYSDFTQMSAGQPRPTQKERFRQRFMHKLVYFPNNQDGIFGCVGCGRCLQKCPIHMNIVKVAKTLKEGM